VSQLPTATPVTISSAGTLDLNGASQTVASVADGAGGGGTVTNSSTGSSATLTLAPASGTSTTFSGTIQNGNGNVSLALNGADNTAQQWLAGVNTFSGTTTVNNGTLVLANSGALLSSTLNANSALTDSGIVFDQAGSGAFTLGGLTGSGNLALQDDASHPVALTVGGNNSATTYWGVLSDNGSGGSLTKIGTGMLTVNGNGTLVNWNSVGASGLSSATNDSLGGTAYTGPTTVSGGTLVLNNATGGSTGIGGNGGYEYYYTAGSISINNGATLQILAGHVQDLANGASNGGNGHYFMSGPFVSGSFSGPYGAGQNTFTGTTFSFGPTGGGTIDVEAQTYVGSNWPYTWGSAFVTTGGAEDSIIAGTIVNQQYTGQDSLNVNGGYLIFNVTHGSVGNVGNPVDLNVTDGIFFAEGGGAEGVGILKIGNGVLQLGASNVGAGAFTYNNSHFNGGTVLVAGGTLALAGSGAVYDGVLNPVSLSAAAASEISAVLGITVPAGTGSIAFNSTVPGHAFTIGGLGAVGTFAPYENGSVAGLAQDNIALQDTAGNPVALTVGENGSDNNISPTTTYSGVLSGPGSLTKVGTGGMLTLAGPNTYSGGTTVTAGTLQLGNAQGLGTGGLTMSAPGVLDLNGYSATAASLSGASGTITDSSAGPGPTTFTVQQNVNTTYSGVLADGPNASLAFVKAGNGRLTLSASNGYSGGTTVSGGTLQLGNPNALGSGGLTANAGVLDLNGLAPSNPLPFLAGAAGTITDSSTAANTLLIVTQAGNTTFGGSFQTGARGATISLQKNGGGSLTLGGQSTLASVTVGDTGTLNVGGSLTTPSLYVPSATLNVSGSLTIATASGLLDIGVDTGPGQLAGGGSITLANSAGLLDYESTAGTSTFGGQLAGPGYLLVEVGSLVLAGSNTFTGGAVVSGDEGPATLQLGNGGATGSIANSTVTDNSVLAVSRSDNVALSSLINGALTGSGGLAQIGPGTLVLSGTNTYSGGTTVSGGTLVLADNAALADGSNLTVGNNLGAFPSLVPASSSDARGAATAAVPEPGTLALLAAALGCAAICRRLRRRS
jgi:autotransporter-associated beta strand protein